MKKENLLFITLSCILFLFTVINNEENKVDLSITNLTFDNIEALAGCESDVKKEPGRATTLECINSVGETYDLDVCDFGSYSTECHGRDVN